MLNPAVSPSRIVRYDTLVRLTTYRSKHKTFDSDRFVDAWRALTAAPAKGVLYRELDRQVAEWSRLAAAEIDAPIDAQFIEYLVAEAEADLAAAPALPAGLEGDWELTQDLHTVAFRFVKENVPQAGALMFNLFQIHGPAGMEQGFLMDWPARGEFKIKEPTTLSTMLHQRLLPKAEFHAFNRVEVTSAADYAEGIERFEQAFPRKERLAAAGPASAKPPVQSHLGLFEIAAFWALPERDVPSKPQMQAIVLDKFGPPSVLRSLSIPRPEPGPGEIRVKVKASSINPLDVQMRAGKVAHMYPSWFPEVIGYSASGVVDALGAGVTERSLGEEVYGINNPIRRHGYAEYMVAPAAFFYPKPARMDWATAAAAPSIFATAYGSLFLRANLQKGQTLLIHGGAGVIGSFAVQLAHQAGARVIATAAGSNMERVRQLGADLVVDYKTQRFEDFARGVDLVLDTVGGETRDRSWQVLRKGGILASLVPPPPDQATAAKYGVQAFMVHGHPNIAEIMPDITRRFEDGSLAFPEVAAKYPLAKAAEAHAAFESSAPRGRIVLTVEP